MSISCDFEPGIFEQAKQHIFLVCVYSNFWIYCLIENCIKTLKKCIVPFVCRDRQSLNSKIVLIF